MNKTPVHMLMMPDYRLDNPYQALLTESLEALGVRVSFPQGYRRGLPILRMVSSQPEPISVVHLHWLTPYLKGNGLIRWVYAIKFWLDLWLTQLRGVRVVWTIHNEQSHDGAFPRLEQWLNQRLLHQVDRLIVHHDATRQAIAHTYAIDPAKFTVIPHGHYRGAYPPAIDPQVARTQLALPQTGQIYLTLGMLRPYKGIERLLKVWQDQEFARVGCLVVAGKALDADYQAKLTRLVTGVKGVFLVPEFIPADRIPWFFSAADVVVLPFEQILTSGSLILAMSYGKPIIAPRLGGIAETLGEASSFLYDPSEAQGLAEALHRSRQSDLEAIAQITRDVCDRLDWHPIAQQTLQAYQRDCRREG